jgi:hypothetical protein
VMAEEFGDSINVDAAHDEVAGESGAEHFDVGADAGQIGVSKDFRPNVTFDGLVALGLKDVLLGLLFEFRGSGTRQTFINLSRSPEI